MKYIIDFETNAIDFQAWNKGDRSSLKQIHCLCVVNADSGESHVFTRGSIESGIDMIRAADEIIAHNAKFDVSVFEAWTGTPLPSRIKVTCTYKAAKSMFPEGFREERISNPDRKGSHSLEAWGYRLGVLKGSKPLDWDSFDPMMVAYCLQDCTVTLALHRFLMRRKRWGFMSPLVERLVGA
jgi:DNA polymerase III epsilon subunit-like protein